MTESGAAKQAVTGRTGFDAESPEQCLAGPGDRLQSLAPGQIAVTGGPPRTLGSGMQAFGVSF